MAQNRQNDKIPRAENYTMYSAFSTDAHAAEHAQRKANREKAQQGAKREYHNQCEKQGNDFLHFVFSFKKFLSAHRSIFLNKS